MGGDPAVSDASANYDKAEADEFGIVVEQEQPFFNYFWEDAMWTVRLGVPLVVGNGSKMIQQMFISIMLGRKSTNLLAAVTVSGIWTGWADAMVAAGAAQIGTLCSMAYGAGNFFLVGTWLQIGLLWLTVLYPPIALFRYVTGPMLEFFGVPVAVSVLAGSFTAWSAPTVIFELYYMAIHMYFVCLGVVQPDAVISIVYIGVAVVLVWLGVYYFDMGPVGIALALSLKRILRLLTLVGYCSWMGYHRKTWGGWNWSEVMSRKKWDVFLPLAIPAMISGIASTIQHSVGALIAARLGAESSAAYDLILTVYMLMNTAVSAIAAGIGILMARSLGEGRPTRAWEVTKVGCVLTYGGLIISALAFYAFMPAYAGFASYDPQVRKDVFDARIVGAVAMLLSGGVGLIAEVMVKQGRPLIVFTTLPLFTWFIGIPWGFFAAPIYGLNGIIWGNVVAYSLAHLVLGYYLYYSDWTVLAKEARERSEVDKKKSESNLTGSEVDQKKTDSNLTEPVEATK